MKKSGARAFWVAFFLTLAILMPLLGALIFYSAWQGGAAAAPAAESQAGVPVDKPGAANDLTALAVVAAEEPSFVLVRLNALENEITLCPVPAESVLLGPTGAVLLADSYASAGPARAAQLLASTLNIVIDRYIAIAPASLAEAWGELAPVRVNLTGLLEQSELDALGLAADPVVSLEPGQATAFVAALQLPVAREARVRGAVWQAAFRHQLEALPTALPAGPRAARGGLLTDLTATDLYDLGDTLGFLARGQAAVTAETVPGRYDKQSGRYDFAQDSIAFATTRFVPAQGDAAGPAASAAASDGLPVASPSPQPSPEPSQSP